MFDYSTPMGSSPGGRNDYSKVQTKADYFALPRGSKYIAPDGSQRIKG